MPSGSRGELFLLSGDLRLAFITLILTLLLQLFYSSIHVYEEAHSGFLSPWTTLVAFKDIKTRANWYRSPAEIELQLQKRILPSKTGASSLRYFDGATMHSYQMPSNAFETVHCRQENVPEGCDRTTWIGKVSSNETTNKTTAYDPVVERRGMDSSLHSREYAVHGFGWKNKFF